MAKKKLPRQKAQTPPPRPAVTAERFTRLYKLVTMLGAGQVGRDKLTAQLGLDVRGFYRDLEALRGVTIPVKFAEGEYSLGEPLAAALARLPFPDPHLSLGQARQLAKGKTKLHKEMLGRIEGLVGGAE